MQKTDPNRNDPMFTADGFFLCDACVKENAALIDDAAKEANTPASLRVSLLTSSWACVGYCGDTIGKLIINSPQAGDVCCHCNKEITT